MKRVLTIERFTRHSILVIFLVGMTSLGCGKSVPTGTVQGKVTLNGQPYDNAVVAFMCLDTGYVALADIQSEGAFVIAEPVPVGNYTVYLAPKADPGGGDEPRPVTIDQSIPDKYWNESSSDIKIDVKEGENDVAVELKN